MTAVKGHVRIVPVEDLPEDEHPCPECEETFDEDVWDELGGHHYLRSGGHTRYGCPTSDCHGRVHVVV